jgi:hypothetical protein
MRQLAILWRWWRPGGRRADDALQRQLADALANLRKAKRELASARAHEDDQASALRKEVRSRIAAEKQTELLAVMVDELTSQVAALRAQVAALRAESAAAKPPGGPSPGARLLPLPDLPPGWKQFGHGPYTATFTVVTPETHAAFVSVAAASRDALRAALDPFLALEAMSVPPIQVVIPGAEELDGK